jgi:dimethylamine monooxygenase subunit A
VTELPIPARYFPIDPGRYELAPGLHALGHDFGNDGQDGKIFQIDREFPRFRRSKLEARRERLSKYFATRELSPEVERAVESFLADRMAQDNPAWFERRDHLLECRLTGETIALRGAPPPGVSPPYASVLDSLCCQVAEDMAVLSTREGANWISALHLCSPENWGAEEKIGKSFLETHAPVPHIERITRGAAGFVDAMVNKGPFVRFLWGFVPNDRLNRHREPAPGVAPAEWMGTFDFSAREPRCFLRVERQTLHGLPSVGAAIFTIRIHFVPGSEIRSDPRKRALLASGLRAMSPETLAYKRVDKDLPEILRWLESPGA